MIRRFSPENFGIMEFRSERDYGLCTKIRGDHPLLNEHGYRFAGELHMTNDSHFFRKLSGKKPGAGQLPLYEGKMIWQFDANFLPATTPSWKRKSARNCCGRKFTGWPNWFAKWNPKIWREGHARKSAKNWKSGEMKFPRPKKFKLAF